MIVVERRRTLNLFGLLAVGLVPFLFQSFPPMPVATVLAPAIVGVELLIYVLFVTISASHVGVGGALYVAVMLTALRLGLCLAGAVFLAAGPAETFPASLRMLYIGNPLAILIQMLLLLMLAPHLLQGLFPRLLSEKDSEVLGQETAVESAPASPALPSGGYVQVYTYEELVDFMRKIVGLEGFFFYSDEGFPLLSHSPFAMDEETAAVAANDLFRHVQQWGTRLRVSNAQRLLIETPDHYVVNQAITPRVRLLALFTRTTPAEAVAARADRIHKTASEFLRSRGEPSGKPGSGKRG